MESIASYFESFDFDSLWMSALILLLGTLLLGIIGRFVFGKRSALNHAISSTIGILFIYALTIVLRSAGASFEVLVAPLPFVSFSEESMYLFTFAGAHYTVICSQILSTIILAFLVNLTESWLPKGKTMFTWILFRCLTVIIAYVLHLIVICLFNTFLPAGIVTYAPTILLAILIFLLVLGLLKFVLGAILSTLNPVIGGLYKFFFTTVIGKQISKGILTTVILIAMVVGLQYAGVGVISIASAALLAYVPFLIVLLVLWFVIFKLF